MGGVRKKSVGAKKVILGNQAWDRQSLDIMNSWVWNEREANEKMTPKSSGLHGGDVHNDTEQGRATVCVCV